MDDEWNDYFMGIAMAVSQKSHCLSHKFGAIAVNGDHCIVSTGYNGPPRGYPHCEPVDIKDESFAGKGCPRRALGYKSGQGLHICPAAHAERNVLINAARYGTRLHCCALYTTSPTPCRECAKDIVNAGIFVVYCNDAEYPEDGVSGLSILEKCGIRVVRLPITVR